MKMEEKTAVNPNETMKTVNSIQQIVNDLILQGINATIVQKPASINFLVPDGNRL